MYGVIPAHVKTNNVISFYSICGSAILVGCCSRLRDRI